MHFAAYDVLYPSKWLHPKVIKTGSRKKPEYVNSLRESRILARLSPRLRLSPGLSFSLKLAEDSRSNYFLIKEFQSAAPGEKELTRLYPSVQFHNWVFAAVPSWTEVIFRSANSSLSSKYVGCEQSFTSRRLAKLNYRSQLVFSERSDDSQLIGCANCLTKFIETSIQGFTNACHFSKLLRFFGYSDWPIFSFLFLIFTRLVLFDPSRM